MIREFACAEQAGEAAVTLREIGRSEKMAENLLRENWGNLDSQELKLLLEKRIGGPGQFDGRGFASMDYLRLILVRIARLGG